MPLKSSSLVQYESPTIDKEWKPVTKHAIYTGLLSGVGSFFLLGESGQSNILNTSVPSTIAVGAATSIRSIASDLLSDYVL